ncbi:MAG TPA: hypothetical protein VFY03_03745 [Woeseiaceae bacterium]|nr:hypothetical protein [Woeseiaceae bacterium]
MNQNPDRASSFDTPAADSASTTSRVAEKAHRAIDESASRAENLERKVRDKAGEAQDKLAASRQRASLKVDESLGEVEAFVRERPLAATGIAFAAGVLVAALLRR